MKSMSVSVYSLVAASLLGFGLAKNAHAASHVIVDVTADVPTNFDGHGDSLPADNAKKVKDHIKKGDGGAQQGGDTLCCTNGSKKLNAGDINLGSGGNVKFKKDGTGKWKADFSLDTGKHCDSPDICPFAKKTEVSL